MRGISLLIGIAGYAFALTGGKYISLRGRRPPTIARIEMPVNTLQLVADSMYTKNIKLCSRLESGRIAFLTSPGAGETYDVYLRFIGKRVVDFLLVLIELFSLGVIQLRRSGRISIENRRFRSRVSLTHNFRYKLSPPPPTILFLSLVR